MAFFRPNASLLGNIKLSIWHFQKPITDIEAFAWKVSLLMIVDFLSFFINGILLWWFCCINLLKVLKQLQVDFWKTFAITEAYTLMEVFRNTLIQSRTKFRVFLNGTTISFQYFGMLCIGSGFDLTLSFDWSDGRYSAM